jgi:hypothetical protein
MATYVGPLRPPQGFDAKELTSALEGLKGGGESKCTKVGGDCPAAEEVLKAIYGPLYYPEWPHLLVYFERPSPSVAKLHLAASVLVWKEKTTPFLYGVHDIWVVVVAEDEMKATDLVATLETLRPAWVNPFEAVFSMIGGSTDAGQTAGAAEAGEDGGKGSPATPPTGDHTSPGTLSKRIDLRLFVPQHKVSEHSAAIWVGTTGFPVTEDTVHRLTLRTKPKESKTGEKVVLISESIVISGSGDATRPVAGDARISGA